MSSWETNGKTDEWYTPAYVFDALGVVFDLDVAHPAGLKTDVPCKNIITQESLQKQWSGFVWMNPPFGGRMGLVPWLDKFFDHGNGVALTPDRTSAPWWQSAARKADAILFVDGKIKFVKPDGTIGKSPGTGTTLFAIGAQGVKALKNAQSADLGWLMVPA